jgi:hypothetical protein
MATQYFGLDRGDINDLAPDGMHQGTSTTSKSLELAIVDTAGWTTLEIQQALDAIMQRILDGRFTVLGTV